MNITLKKIAIWILLLCVLLVGWQWYALTQYMQQPLRVPEQGYILDVQAGSHLTRILQKLKQDGVIDNTHYIKLYARLNDLAQKVHVGEYQLSSDMSPAMLLADLTAGKVIQYSITIVEGWTFRQLVDHLNENSHLTHTIAKMDDDAIMQAIGHAGQHPEGRFMADTYHFPRGLNDVDFLKRSYEAMQAYLDQVWPDRDVGLPIKTPYEALILASIVEKETGLANERRTIAGVFTRRLQQRMRLQTDPTVIYGMGEQFKGNIRRRDLQEDNPYNTYQRFGLPPTPIALPGKDAIDAVLHPEEGDVLYFVSKGDGSHHFSATLEQHNEAVIRYQLKGRKRPFSSYKPE